MNYVMYMSFLVLVLVLDVRENDKKNNVFLVDHWPVIEFESNFISGVSLCDQFFTVHHFKPIFFTVSL